MYANMTDHPNSTGPKPNQTDFPTIQCIVVDFKKSLEIELADIDKKLIHGNLSAAEHAILTGQRSEIMQELAAVSQFATASKQVSRRGAEKTGHHVASVRDQAKRTGKSKVKVQRSKKRWEILGSHLLYRIVGTTLDSGRELDALAQLPEVEREALTSRAGAGKSVSARTPGRKRRVWPGVRRTCERGSQK